MACRGILNGRTVNGTSAEEPAASAERSGIILLGALLLPWHQFKYEAEVTDFSDVVLGAFGGGTSRLSRQSLDKNQRSASSENVGEVSSAGYIEKLCAQVFDIVLKTHSLPKSDTQSDAEVNKGIHQSWTKLQNYVMGVEKDDGTFISMGTREELRSLLVKYFEDLQTSREDVRSTCLEDIAETAEHHIDYFCYLSSVIFQEALYYKIHPAFLLQLTIHLMVALRYGVTYDDIMSQYHKALCAKRSQVANEIKKFLEAKLCESSPLTKTSSSNPPQTKPQPTVDDYLLVLKQISPKLRMRFDSKGQFMYRGEDAVNIEDFLRPRFDQDSLAATYALWALHHWKCYEDDTDGRTQFHARLYATYLYLAAAGTSFARFAPGIRYGRFEEALVVLGHCFSQVKKYKSAINGELLKVLNKRADNLDQGPMTIAKRTLKKIASRFRTVPSTPATVSYRSNAHNMKICLLFQIDTNLTESGALSHAACTTFAAHVDQASIYLQNARDWEKASTAPTVWITTKATD